MNRTSRRAVGTRNYSSTRQANSEKNHKTTTGSRCHLTWSWISEPAAKKCCFALCTEHCNLANARRLATTIASQLLSHEDDGEAEAVGVAAHRKWGENWAGSGQIRTSLMSMTTTLAIMVNKHCIGETEEISDTAEVLRAMPKDREELGQA